MKTLLVTIEYPPFKGGVAKVYENIAKHWPICTKQGKPSFVKEATSKSQNNFFILHNNDKKLVNEKYKPAWLPAFLNIWKNIRENKIDHVLVGHLLPLGTVVYFLSKIMKFKYSVIIHGMEFDYAMRVERKKKITRKIFDNAAHIICMNAYVSEKVAEFVKDDTKVEVVNPGINVEL
jgi:glycosyltransferase involved in cell wall biosynthesis